MKIEISEEDYRFLQELANEMNTQDNRGTGSPYFYTIRFEKWHPVPEGFGDKTVYVDWMDDPKEYESPEAAREEFIEYYGMSEQEAEDRVSRLQKFEMAPHYYNKNVFLTKRGYDEHLRLNKHNLDNECVNGANYYSYVDHAWRNPELAQLFEVIKRLGTAAPAEGPFEVH